MSQSAPTVPAAAAVSSEPPSRYAKLARPRLFGAMPRPRLFARIEALRARHPVLWIHSPPGAGKTTLAASYLAHMGGSAIWCQLDQGDADPATLFFFLAETVRDTGAALPWNLAQAGGGQARFERLFFRDYFARLPAGAVVVLDNVHEFDWDNAGELLELAFCEVPDGVTVLALSRDAPPARLSRLELSGRLATLGWNEMRLDDGETAALCGDSGVPDATRQAWIGLVDGWITGLMLLKNLGSHSDQAMVSVLHGRDAVFRYFAGEIFERMPARSRHLLMLLSCLPGVSADDAGRLTGDPAAAALLGKLYRDRMFVERRGAPCHSYHFHALFREFLQHEAAQRLAPAERQDLLERAAGILEAQGRIDDAARLYQDIGAHAALCRLLLAQAGDMLAAGRGQAWREWMSTLPPEHIDNNPHIWYWHGVSLTEVTPIRGRQMLMRAEQAFLAGAESEGEGNAGARALAIVAIIDSHDFEWGDVSALPHWIEQLTLELARQDGDQMAPALALAIHSRLTIALMFVLPESPELPLAAQRALAVLQRVPSRVEQLAAGAILLRYFDWSDRPDMAHWLVTELGKVADDPLLSPFHRVRWYGRVAWWYNKEGHFAQAEQMTGSAKRIVASHNLDPLLFQLLEVHHLLGMGELPPARRLLDEIRQARRPGGALELVELHGLEANWRSLSDDIDGAIGAALEAVEACRAAGLPASVRGRFELFLAACHAVGGQFGEARRWQVSAQAHALGFDAALAEEAGSFLLCHEYFCQGQPDQATALLRASMERHAQRRATTLFIMLPRLAGALAAHALEHAICVDHVRALIISQRLAPPSRHAPNWPWPVAVRSLGKFELSLNGVPTVATGKAQQRPLTLLKALVGAGEAGKTQQRLAAQLWPTADDARSALNVTVHRLRKLLGSDDMISVSAGNVRLVHDKLWSDVDALGALCERIELYVTENEANANADADNAARLAAELLQLYRGPFCDGSDEAWVLATREQCRNRFLTALARLAGRLEQAGRWSDAAVLYQRALEAEPLAEITYRNLMRCAHAQGDPAAAFSAFRRCRETLSIVLGRQPSPDTEELAVALGLKPRG